MSEAQPLTRVKARAGQPFPRLTVVHEVEGRGTKWFALRYIVGPMGIVHMDKSRQAALPEAAAEWARGDAVRIAATLARVRGSYDKHADECEREADAIVADAQAARLAAWQDRKAADQTREQMEASRVRQSTLLSAVEAAKWRVMGGKRVAVASLQPKDMVRAEALPSLESEQERMVILEAQLVEREEAAKAKDADATRIEAMVQAKRDRAAVLRAEGRKHGDEFIMQQKGRDFTW